MDVLVLALTPSLTPKQLTRSLKPSIPWARQGRYYCKSLLYSGEVPFRLRLGLFHAPPAVDDLKRDGFKPVVAAIAFDASTALDFAPLVQFSDELIELEPRCLRVLVGVTRGKTPPPSRTRAIKLADEGGFHAYYEVISAKVESLRKVAFALVLSALKEIERTGPDEYTAVKQGFVKFKFARARSNPASRNEEESYLRELVDAWFEEKQKGDLET